MSEFLYVEKYRPHKIEDCILPDRLKKVFQEYVTEGNIPNLMLTGTAGCGKTTVAKAMCEEIGCNFLFINSSDERGIDTLRTKIKGYASTVSLTGGRKVIILDETDYLTPEAQAGLRGAIEEFSENCSFIFTCNFKNRIIDPIHSRCTCIDFRMEGSQKQKIATQFFKRVCDILDNEGVTYDKQVVAAVITKHFPDNRRVLNELQRYSVSGTIDKGILASVSDVQINELMSAIMNKDFASCRKWVTNSLDSDPTRIFRSLYDALYEKLKPNSVPQMVLILAKYQYQAAFVADHEINLIACLTEIMVECEFK